MIAFPYKKSYRLSLARWTSAWTCALVVVCGALLGLSRPAAAQIASTVDDNGRVVFVNAEPPIEKKKPKEKEPKVTAASNSENPGEHKNGGLTTEPAGHDMPRSDAASDRTTALNVRQERQAVSPERLERIVNEAAARHDLDPALVSSVIDVESNWNQSAISRKGALGLMQLIPTTAGEMGVRDAFDPAQNIEGGTSYLRLLLDRFHGDIPKSLAAYNAGPAAVERRGAIPNIPETQAYVKKVTTDYFRRGQGKTITLLPKPRIPVRREIDSQGHALFTNE